MTDHGDSLDDEALRHASEHYGIPLDAPGAEDRLRRTSAFAWQRLYLAVRELGRNVRAALPRWFDQ